MGGAALGSPCPIGGLHRSSASSNDPHPASMVQPYAWPDQHLLPTIQVRVGTVKHDRRACSMRCALARSIP